MRRLVAPTKWTRRSSTSSVLMHKSYHHIRISQNVLTLGKNLCFEFLSSFLLRKLPKATKRANDSASSDQYFEEKICHFQMSTSGGYSFMSSMCLMNTSRTLFVYSAICKVYRETMKRSCLWTLIC
ncbi:hypothetical protein Y032_0636g939 [Ancylostoma ceylanicum]|nr:hypothetical protein Y032_0636g939 [Ancylostoma ceylanicum]